MYFNFSPKAHKTLRLSSVTLDNHYLFLCISWVFAFLPGFWSKSALLLTNSRVKRLVLVCMCVALLLSGVPGVVPSSLVVAPVRGPLRLGCYRFIPVVLQCSARSAARVISRTSSAATAFLTALCYARWSLPWCYHHRASPER